ncbi:MAG TPA: right-handed parallel beta-helix repeat-containing protein [Vicinamibacterales bacterium]|nr:right-handed parallel beta-helix repeat-containing protein [Vicinamibacterales bacterium]
MLTIRAFQLAAPCLILIALADTGDAQQTLQVRQGDSLQQALDRARPGDTILLSPGATYVGNFVLPKTPGSQVITVRTADADGQPRPGVRITPAHAPALAKLRSPDRQPALRTAPGARNWRLQLLEFQATRDGAGDIITLGDGSSAQRERSQVPEQLVIDQCYIHGDPVDGQKRGIALNSGATSITNSYISDIKTKGFDSQAIAGWNGPGPYTIENNYLEAAGENIMFGGADPAIRDLVTEDIVVRRNHLAKPVAWRGTGWTIKNLFELKNARRVLVEGNVMEYSWLDAQIGYAIVLTPRNQDGGAPWATVEDVTIRYNVVRHAGGGMQIIGEDSNHPSRSTHRVVVAHNLFYGIDSGKWGGSGAFVLIGEGPSEVTIEHNTVRQSGNILMAYGGTKAQPKAIPGFRFRDNLVLHNQYGVHGNDRAVGQDTLQAYFPGAVFRDNGIGGGDPARYPGGNIFVPETQFDAQFVDAAKGDYRLRPDSRFKGRASDKKDLGADFNALALALGVRPSRMP